MFSYPKITYSIVLVSEINIIHPTSVIWIYFNPQKRTPSELSYMTNCILRITGKRPF